MFEFIHIYKHDSISELKDFCREQNGVNGHNNVFFSSSRKISRSLRTACFFFN